LEHQNNQGNTALLMAAKIGDLKIVKELIKNGANIHHKNKNGDDVYDITKFNILIKECIEENYPEFVDAKKYKL
jgi:ankyrin repeat protein